MTSSLPVILLSPLLFPRKHHIPLKHLNPHLTIHHLDNPRPHLPHRRISLQPVIVKYHLPVLSRAQPPGTLQLPLISATEQQRRLTLRIQPLHALRRRVAHVVKIGVVTIAAEEQHVRR